LTGISPFYGKTYNEVITKNKECKIDFDKEYWGKVSPEGKNLCMMMLKRDPHERISSESAMGHNWFTHSMDEFTDLTNVIENISKYT